MKFIWTTTVRQVKDHSPILEGHKDKASGEQVFTFGRKVKRIITEDNIGFDYEGETAPAPGTALRITIETI